jgi:hypothetical protein
MLTHISDVLDFSSNLVITDHMVVSESPWVTVLVGENGTKKSLLLRLIASEAAYGMGARKKAFFTSKISKLIALSGTPHDRFPRSQRQTLCKYAYFGLKAANNVVGVGNSEKSLIQALIANRNKIKKRKSEFELIFGQLGLEPSIKAEFRMSRIFDLEFRRLPNNYKIEEIKSRIERHISKVNDTQWSEQQDKRDIDATLKFLSDTDNHIHLLSTLDSLGKKPRTVTISPAQNYVSANTFPVAVWRLLLEAGVTDFKKAWFTPKKESQAQWELELVPGDYLSSGQWSWLCTLGGLAAEVDDDCTILIDEPENSLHPAWQRDYVPTLINILDRFKNCHAILATHAPLIASGLPPNSGNVRRLKRETNEDGGHVITSFEAPNTFGWSASDAYETLFQLETTRAKIFNIDASKALEIIRTKTGTSEECTRLIEAMNEYCESLPSLDPMRRVMENIAISLKNIISSNEG